MSTGRSAALPAAGYALPQRLFVGESECRVRVLPEDGGPPADIDLIVLPVSRELRTPPSTTSPVVARWTRVLLSC